MTGNSTPSDDRTKAILSSPLASGQEPLAAHLAAETELSGGGSPDHGHLGA